MRFRPLYWVIKNAEIFCEDSGQAISDHFVDAYKLIKLVLLDEPKNTDKE